MNAIATILATAAVTAGSIRAVREIRKRLKRASDHKDLKGKRGDGRVIDLEKDAETGVYGVSKRR